MDLFMRTFTEIIFTSIFVGTSAMAGGMTSSGTDSKAISSGAAWFLGTAPINYCIDIAAGQTVNESRVDAAFQTALKTWQAYMSENLDYNPIADEKINFNFQKQNCNSTTQLKIYVGVHNAEIQKAKDNFEKPYAFANRTSYDMKTRSGSGFIWLAPNALKEVNTPKWELAYQLEGMLLHEVGHMIGCGHVPGTIMDADIVPKMQMASSNDPNWAAYGKYFMTHVDHHGFLKATQDKQFEIKGQINQYNNQESERLFEVITGKKPQGEIIVTVKKVSGPLKLILADKQSSSEFEILLPRSNTSEFSTDSVLFKVAYEQSINSAMATFTSSSGYSTTTTIKAKNGKEYTIQVNINVGDIGRPVTLKIQEPGSPLMKSLFTSDLWLTIGLPR